MNTLPAQPNPSFQPGKASQLVASVLPAAGSRPAPSAEDQLQRELPQKGDVDQSRREALMAQHRGHIRADTAAGGGRARRAMAHYDAVAAIEQRQQLEETLRFSVWA